MNAGRDRGVGFAIWVVLVFIWRPAQNMTGRPVAGTAVRRWERSHITTRCQPLVDREDTHKPPASA